MCQTNVSTCSDSFDDQVTPQYEYVPKRSYLRNGKVVKCYLIVADSGSILDRKLTLDDIPLFTLEFSSETLAQQLMEDLYYGEYTGG